MNFISGLKHFNLFPTVSQLTLNPPIKINKNVGFSHDLTRWTEGVENPSPVVSD